MPRRNLMLFSDLDPRPTLEGLASAADLHPDLVARFAAYGLLEPVSTRGAELRFDFTAISRLRTIRRLRSDLGINLPGIAVVLDLVERIETLQRELAELRRMRRTQKRQ